MIKTAARVIVLVDDGKSRTAYRAAYPLFLAKLLYKGCFTGAERPMKGVYLSVAGLLPELAGRGGDIVYGKLQFHAAKVAGKLQQGIYIISPRLGIRR